MSITDDFGSSIPGAEPGIPTNIKGKSFCEIGRICGVTDNAVRRWCKRLGIYNLNQYSQKRSKKSVWFEEGLGVLAQSIRVPRLHRGGRGFESLNKHQNKFC